MISITVNATKAYKKIKKAESTVKKSGIAMVTTPVKKGRYLRRYWFHSPVEYAKVFGELRWKMITTQLQDDLKKSIHDAFGDTTGFTATSKVLFEFVDDMAKESQKHITQGKLGKNTWQYENRKSRAAAYGFKLNGVKVIKKYGIPVPFGIASGAYLRGIKATWTLRSR